MTKENKNQISTHSGTPYDDVYRTLVNDCPGLMIPIVNEVFGKNHQTGEEIAVLSTDIFMNRQDGEQLEKITDSTFKIEGSRYHIECQSTIDGTMLIRIFEYDSQLALRDAVIENGTLHVHFPNTAVIYLRTRSTTQDYMTIHISVSGDECSYQIPAMKVQDYTVDEIFEKKLYFLIPFHIFTYESNFVEYETNNQRLCDLKEIYIQIMDRLEQHRKEGYITEYMRQTIIDMSKKVLNHLCAKQTKVREGVREIMGGKVLEYEAKTILRNGIKEGARQQLASLISKKLAKGQDIPSIADVLEESEDTIRTLIKEYKLTD